MAVARAERPSVPHIAEAPPEERDLVERVMADVLTFENGIGTDFKENCEKWYRQYRGFRQFRDAWVQSRGSEEDRDEVLRDAKRDWGAHLHIPLSYRTIETMVPRAIAHRPRLLYMPRQERWAQNVQNVRLLIDSQQEQIDIDLPFQAVMRSGRIYGIGVGKSYWRKEYAPRRRVKQRLFRPGDYTLTKARRELTFDDPVFEDVDVFDFMWDPYGHDVASCGWMVHRTWTSLEGVLARVESGAWPTQSAQALDEEKLRSIGSSQKYDESWQMRMEASGFGRSHFSTRGEHIHEVLEWHDGERVRSVLDRCVLVQDNENPCMGHKPFHVYRPTPLQKQMVGIGDLEPLEHLQRELDTLRSQRRDMVTLSLLPVFAYEDGLVEEEDLNWFPGAAIPVRNGRPSDAITPLQMRDVPGAGYQEEQVVRADFDAVSGITDALDASSGGQVSTATEAQLMQAALSRRIELGARRFEVEVVRQAARAFLYLNQRMILTDRDPIRQPDDGLDEAEAARTGRWKWFPMGPQEIQGEFSIVPEGGSMAARNIPQDRQDATLVMQMFGANPHIDPRRPLMRALELVGVKDPESWLKQSDPPVPPIVFEALQRMGVKPQVLQTAIRVAQQSDPRLAPEQQGPNAQQVDQMMGAPA